MHRLLTLLLALSTADARPWTDDVMYFVLTDRFHDGDPSNNVPAGSDPGLHDPAQKDIRRYHGGDLRGLELAIQSGYFKDLGVSALWITPPVRNVWKSGPGEGATGYHGYWPQDLEKHRRHPRRQAPPPPRGIVRHPAPRPVFSAPAKIVHKSLVFG